MKNHKRLLSLIICAALLICSLPMSVAAASDFPTVLAEAKKGVVQIYGLGESTLFLNSWIGTGFAVGEQGKDSDVFLTNWHVVAGNGDYSLDKVRLWILQEDCEFDEQTLEPDPNKSIACEVLKTTTGYPDYAIIRATEPIEGYKPLPLLSSKEVPDGLKVYALGYPGVVGNASASHYGIDDITATDGIISQHMQYALEGNTWVLMHTAQISGGNSGGPLITEEGAVVGLNTYGFGENEANMNRYCAVYIDYAMEGLDELGLPYEAFESQTSEPPAETEPNANSPAKTEPKDDSTEETESGEKEEQKDSGDSEDDENLILWIAVGSAAVIAAVAVLIILLKKKKAKEEAQRRQEEARRQEAERRRMEEERRRQEEARRRQEAEKHRRAQEVKAQLQLNGGTLYPVRAAGCIIGRENDCTIILPENTPGVSRHHCKLEFHADQLILTDLNSRYGTYIHGKRIPDNTPVALKPGSSFCLGSEKCRFTVC